ncbi:thioesterase II family protein [Cohnella sp. WQ 127256]|uniref:thioesterase II family protein n=1 Tax=Cohnella sp. WQ 127256 TaxID=2938790 RepID=UPI0021174E99|nr:alpha/beta fold hydrolase [Cohnella sp. WQ 127256]
MKLICIPYAGGSATVYYPWKKLIHPSIKVVPLELAGRGERMGQSFYRSIEADGTDDLYRSVEKELDGSPIALFGHSMGTLFAYELAHRIVRETGQPLAHLFLSGRGAPHTARSESVIHELPDPEFQAEVLRLGGTPAELFQHKELSDIYMPILRSDYRLSETYRDTGKPDKLDCGITVMRGTQDSYGRTEAEEWNQYVSGDTRIVEYDGGHFFIHEFRQQVLSAIHESLLSMRSSQI